MAEALRNVAAHFQGFAARYGGDEFCLVLDRTDVEPKEVVAQLHLALEQVKKTYKARDVSPSVGWTICCEPERDLSRILSRAAV